MKVNKIVFYGLLLVALLAFTGCTGTKSIPAQQTTVVETTNPPSTGDSGGKTYNIDISNFAFSPATLNIKKGDTVIWTNSDTVPHTIAGDSGTELESDQLSKGQTYTHTFNTAGTFNYHCSIHKSMTGTITVK